MNAKPKGTPRLADMTVTLDDLAALFAVTRVTVCRWNRENGLPKAAHGRYPLWACVRWRLALHERKDDDGLREARRDLIVEQRRGHGLENARTAAELLPVDDVRRDTQAALRILDEELAALVREAGAVVAVPEAQRQAVLAAAVRRCRERLAAGFTAYAADLGAESDGD